MTGNPRRVLVTGGRGFIGRHIAARFAGEGAGVLVLDTAPEAPPEEPAAEVPFGRWQKSRPSFSLHHLETARLDVATAEAEDAVVSFSPDLIVHAAAQTRPPRSVADPFDDSRTNVLGTLRMLEAARTVGVKGFIFISSAAIYGDSSVLPLTEDAPHRPLSPYGVSKLAATNYVSYYGRAGLLPALSLIPANVYGPGQQAGEDGAVVPAFIRAALRGEPVTIEGDGSQTRDFVYVQDVARANIM
ncbi:MAG TPA: UDP-glucose 4-epimerase, partial [Clostridiales bacterium]|nr:UDP-glucose 4-epimerase [Clostridiales bacterium]